MDIWDLKKIQQIKWDFLAFLLKARKEGKKIAAYSPAAKGNFLKLLRHKSRCNIIRR
jgi:glutathione peroxidase-family protein